jgi:hypothetical protein
MKFHNEDNNYVMFWQNGRISLQNLSSPRCNITIMALRNIDWDHLEHDAVPIG